MNDRHTTTDPGRPSAAGTATTRTAEAGGADEDECKAGPGQVDNDTAAIPRPPTMKTTNELDQLLSRWDAENNATKEIKMSATDQRQRALLTSSGEHIHAIRKLGSSYDAEQYLEAVTEARDVGAGERYADAVLGPDLDMILSATEQDDDVIEGAHRDLRQRGVDPDSASYQQLADALAKVSP